ncbi:DHA2 family efflux MFS transporter permease subunit [Streptosporangium amethystogenes]|uniref:DHA2 family efflux MFS transporter permease subunit n=1 Tax=Streptosporangium amethystogenes TaxID=2002 RepID=UPI00068DC348|nr:DHA2 family efflux MFS transporter permease subunit [Streptosporangium amethystogenes]
MTTSQTRPDDTAFDPALRRIAVAVVLGTIMTVLDATIVNVAMNVLGRELGTSLSTVQWVITGYTLALSMTIPVTGWAVERFGAKATWITSLALFLTGSALCGMAWSAGSLIAFRVLQGIGGGLLIPVAQVMLARAAGPERMGRVMALVSVPAMLAPVLGPVVGGLILDRLPWQWMFLINVPFCAVALVLAVRLLPRDGEHRPESRLDAFGLALLSPGLAALIYGLSQVGEGTGGTQALAGLLGGALLVAAFTVRSLRAPGRALFDVRLFGDRAFAASVATLFLYSVSVFGLMLLIPLYSQAFSGASALEAGLLVAPMGVGAIVTMPIAGRLTDRIGPLFPGGTGILLVLAGVFACTQVDVTAGTAPLAAAILLVGLGHGLTTPSIMAAAYRTLPGTSIPGATTASQISVRVGTALGAALIAVVLQSLTRSDGPGAGAYTGSLWWTFAIAGTALVPVLLIPRR